VSPEFHPSACLTALERILPADASGRLLVAFSGGLDSTALLHALAAAVRDRPRYAVCAVHVDHQLHPDSPQWQQHCAEIARSLEVEFRYARVHVDARSGGVESAARDARYRALREQMGTGDCLLTAHHADDQLETILLALMRGAGAKGMAGMPACRPFGAGWHARPLLEFTREEVRDWARAAGLRWLTDPSNEGLRFDRNYLRREVIPLLTRRWPAAPHAAVRTAAHLADAGALLGGIASDDVASASVGDCLSVERLASLDALRRRNALRFWLKVRGARMPSTRKLLALEHDMLAAGDDRLPCVEWDGFEVRRHRGLLYADAARPALDVSSATTQWSWREPLGLPSGLGRLRFEPTDDSGFSAATLPPRIEVRFRCGGEQLKIAGEAHHRKLKKLLQSSDVLPWWRDRIPLLYVEGELAGVGDLWIAQSFAAKHGEPAVRVVWEGKPKMGMTKVT
jgi:tRNA(Ile)-lysidine synthase